MMNKKIIAPIIITIISVVVQISYAVMIYIEMETIVKDIDIIWLVLFEGIIVYTLIASIKVLKERIEEIKGEEEDDLSKY